MRIVRRVRHYEATQEVGLAISVAAFHHVGPGVLDVVPGELS